MIKKNYFQLFANENYQTFMEISFTSFIFI